MTQERGNMENNLHFSEEFIENSLLNVVFLDREMNVDFISKAARDSFGLGPEEAKGLDLYSFLHKYFESTDRFEKLCNNSDLFHILERNDKYYKTKCCPVRIDKNLIGFAMVFSDITEDVNREKALQQRTAFLNQIIEFIPDMLFVIDKNGTVIVWNEAAEEMTGVKKEDILGKKNYEYAIPIYGKRKPFLADYILEGKLPKAGECISFEKNGDTLTGITDKAVLKGEKRVLWGKASPFYDGEGNLLGAIEIIRDITKIKHMWDELRELAERDPLTGVFNRRQLMILLRRELERCKRTRTPLTIFYIDVDNLKEINDEFGHAEGDELLKNIAEAFTKGLRKVDIVARVGGDEFVIVIPSTNKRKAEKIIERIRIKLKEISKNKKYSVDFSFGTYEVNPLEPTSVENVISIADERMYRMKRTKKE
jgi:diguanylate cyclase (GGDEF)-like protein/PAS domain S-box-containing protein